MNHNYSDKHTVSQKLSNVAYV